MRKLLRVLIAYWGDIIFCLTMPMFVLFCRQELIFNFTDGPFVDRLFVMYCIFTAIALVRLAVTKKRFLRDWLYPAFFAMPAVCLVVFVFYLFPNPSFGGLKEDYYLRQTTVLMLSFLWYAGIARLVIWLCKRYKAKKVPAAVETAELPPEVPDSDLDQ